MSPVIVPASLQLALVCVDVRCVSLSRAIESVSLCVCVVVSVSMSLCVCGPSVSLTTPDDRTLFRYSRKPSSLMSWSVKMKEMPLPCCPATRYRYFRSSSRLDTLYDLQTQSVNHDNRHRFSEPRQQTQTQ